MSSVRGTEKSGIFTKSPDNQYRIGFVMDLRWIFPNVSRRPRVLALVSSSSPLDRTRHLFLSTFLSPPEGQRSTLPPSFRRLTYWCRPTRAYAWCITLPNVRGERKNAIKCASGKNLVLHMHSGTAGGKKMQREERMKNFQRRKYKSWPRTNSFIFPRTFLR